MSSILPPRSFHPVALRRNRVPPAITRGPENMPGAGILDEIPGDLGVTLWRSVRNVALWAATPPHRRGALFCGTAGNVREADVGGLEVDAELVAPLSVMVRLLESPAAMDVLRLVNACRRISAWAERRGSLATALEFMQAAAQAAPQVAALAYAVGRLARRRAEYDRAESWFGRAVVQARRSQDWRSYALAYSGLGNLNVQKGNFPVAQRAHTRCLRTALRHGLEDLQGDAFHDLFAVALETGAGKEAGTLAEHAFRAFGPRHPKLPRLAFDVAFHWMLEGQFANALRLSQALEPHLPGPTEHVLVLSMITRNGGGNGDRAVFEEARRRLDELLATGMVQDAAARALLGVAQGAASLCDWNLAQEYGEKALRAATERREGRMVLAAEATLDSVRARCRAEARQARPAATRFADEFVAALSRQTNELVAAG